MVVVGIDIGTTHGCVGVWHNGRVNIIANDQGFRTTPCFVCFDGEEEVIVGDTAVNKLHSHAQNIVYHLKRVLGKDHEEVREKDFIREWSFEVVKGDDGVAMAQAERAGEAHTIAPVDFVTIMLRNLKELAQDFTGEAVDSAVITMPAHCTEAQNELVREAAQKADLKVLSLLSEPLAAAIAYGLDEGSSGQTEYVLVFDMGGATHDVTLMSVDQGLFEVVASKGNDSLGGEDFTNAVFTHCAASFQRKTKLNVKDNTKSSNRLRLACETAKRSLASQTQVTIEVDSLMEGEDFSLKLSRSRFEDLIGEQVKNSLTEIDALLEEADVHKDDITHVILAGGSSRIPLLQSSVKKYFDGKNTLYHISPDEVVAHGATIEANAQADVSGFDSQDAGVDKVNATPLTLSVGVTNDSVVELIPRDTILPASGSETFTTSQDNQTEVFIRVYEGERVLTKDNTLLAQLRISGIAPAPKGEAEVEVTFTVNTKGVLSVVAQEQASGGKSLEVHHDDKRLTAEDVATLIEKAEEAADADDAILEELEAQEEAELLPIASSSAPAALPTSGGELD